MMHSTPVPFFMWKTILPVLVFGLLVTACDHKVQAPPATVPDVTTISVVRKPVLLTTELPGRTAPYVISEIRPQVNGLILKRLFKEGADVQKGQELYQIDPAPFQAALDNAQAALARSEANLAAVQAKANRVKEALVDKAVSQQDYDDASAALKQNQADIAFYKASVKTAQINLNYAHIVSPISGRIGTSLVTEGAIVTAYQGTPLASIQQLDPIYVDVPQSTAELLLLEQRLKDGRLNHNGTNDSVVQLILEDGSVYPIEGQLQFRDVSVDPTTASVTLRMVFPNPNGILLPGMFVRTVVKEGVNKEAILIPQQTVARDVKGHPIVLIVTTESKVEQRLIVVDRAIGDQWLVASGLSEGEKIIMEGSQKVRAGMTVKASDFVPPSEKQAAQNAQPAPTSK